MSNNRLRYLGKTAFMHATRGLSSETIAKLDHLRVFGRLPDLEVPKSFNDKMQHYKLFDRNPRMPALVDKILVKEHVARTLGPAWVTPTLWQGERASVEILRMLPKPSVIKANHASGMVIFLEEQTDMEGAARRANSWLRYDYHLLHREWAYEFVERRLLVEPRISELDLLHDYKFWVFDGVVRFIQVDKDRFTRHTRQFYDANWNRLELEMNYPADGQGVARPKHLDAMLDAAAKLAVGLPFVRVDLYEAASGPRFGEMTFWPEAGLCRFKPASFDEQLGALWSYPKQPAQEQRAMLGAVA